ncbi:type III-B CRISPR module RAMP protein Cmr4 [Candidatus Contubernalis alkaliaceticus]|uniref:type III-B CRISPR module RAMP protein Cmr4 n=1 Tax=Candidatus Contubernalis alkaliaceticus TaxID=338645 RepID=UPI001F4C28C4|nr:type III-B CRISPR module RAMP protein Cmr4 [Candidatus Contubernalis alkalaceticus]UNC93166.1 type III-B CRISPR module RAMP protein Cmr4 [Candidatus Contubernalis alkalaceticus]
MFTNAKPFLLYALSSIHAGSGSEIGIVDLPVQREKHTGFPKIESSSLKGSIRSAFAEAVEASGDPDNKKKLENVFGSDPDNSDTQAGAIALADARIILFPVKSISGVFAWVTCPLVLERFNQELFMYSDNPTTLPVPEENVVSSNVLIVGEGKIVLEEYTFPVKIDKEANELAERLQAWIFDGFKVNLKDRLVVLSNDDFSDFVKLSTEINARIKINPETGTVDKEKGALWYEENVPPETVFYSFLFTGKVRKNKDNNILLNSEDDVLAFMKNSELFPGVFQLGGNSTLGKGLLRHIWI